MTQGLFFQFQETGTPPKSCIIFRQSNNKLITDYLFRLSLFSCSAHAASNTRLSLCCKRSQAKKTLTITVADHTHCFTKGGWSSYITVGVKASKRKTSVHVVSCKRCFYSTVSVTAARDSLI